MINKICKVLSPKLSRQFLETGRSTSCVKLPSSLPSSSSSAHLSLSPSLSLSVSLSNHSGPGAGLSLGYHGKLMQMVP